MQESCKDFWLRQVHSSEPLLPTCSHIPSLSPRALQNRAWFEPLFLIFPIAEFIWTLSQLSKLALPPSPGVFLCLLRDPVRHPLPSLSPWPPVLGFWALSPGAWQNLATCTCVWDGWELKTLSWSNNSLPEKLSANLKKTMKAKPAAYGVSFGLSFFISELASVTFQGRSPLMWFCFQYSSW